MSIKKYWWILVLFLVLPVAMNFLLQIPAFTPIVGDNVTWLGFWGSYLGAIISAGVAFVILAIQHKQNREENKRNRELQIEENQRNRKLQKNVIKHQQEQARLNRITEIAAKLITDTDVSKLYTICRHLGDSSYNSIDLINELSSRIWNHREELGLYAGFDQKSFMIRLNSFVSSYDAVLRDIRGIIRLFSRSNWDVNIPTLEKFTESASDEMKPIIEKCIASKDYFLKYNDCHEIICGGILFLDKKRLEMNKRIRDYITSEEERIDNILVEEQPDATK